MHAKNKGLTPIRPYDTTMEENMPMYDRLPYKRDADLCNKETHKRISGNVIKYYQCKIQSPVIIDNLDDVITYKIADNYQKSAVSQISTEESMEQQEVSDEQIEELFTD